MKAENVITMLIVLGSVAIGYGGLETGKWLYISGREASERECMIRIERMVRDVDSLTVLVRTLEQEVLSE